MAYVGNQPVPQATQTRDRFVATSGQTSFATSGYTPGFVDVYLDGVKLDQDEYTATNGSDVVLDTGATTGQILEVVAFSSFDVADIRNMTQPLGLKNYTTTQRNALTNIGAGDTIYNSTTGSIEFYDGANWIATNLIPTVNSATGTIYAGAASTLTLSITNATESVTVRFYEGGTNVADVADVTVTSGSASVAVPAAVYGQTAGDTITVSILNQDGTPSSNGVNKTVQGLPTGGDITTYSTYRVHTFTGSGTFSVPSGFSGTADVLIVAGGGGGGGGANATWHGAGGGGAGGMLEQTNVGFSNNNYGITIGGGGSGGAGANDQAPNGSSGANSSAFGYTANGGGFGMGAKNNSVTAAGSGGSGGGGGYSTADNSPGEGGSGTSGQGNSGGYGDSSANPYGGGGGGKGGAGEDRYATGSSNSVSGSTAGGGNGGAAGSNNYQTGSNITYSGGGGAGGASDDSSWGRGGYGGMSTSSTNSGGAGIGGGNTHGNSTDTSQINGGNAAANRGSGGGGGFGGTPWGDAGNGGSGVVVIRYQLP